MFVPCKQVEGVWVVLDEPVNYSAFEVGMSQKDFNFCFPDCQEYQEGKYRVLFEGFYYKSNTGKDRVKWEYITNGVHYFSFKQINDNTIESLLVGYKDKFEIELTQTAQKQILL